MSLNSASFRIRAMLRLRKFVYQNWGSPFIVTFMLLFLGSAVLLSMGFWDIANTTATFAFYSLLPGILLQLICFLKYKNSLFKDEQSNE
jgi:hypothetical protein